MLGALVELNASLGGCSRDSNSSSTVVPPPECLRREQLATLLVRHRGQPYRAAGLSRSRHTRRRSRGEWRLHVALLVNSVRYRTSHSYRGVEARLDLYTSYAR